MNEFLKTRQVLLEQNLNRNDLNALPIAPSSTPRTTIHVPPQSPENVLEPQVLESIPELDHMDVSDLEMSTKTMITGQEDMAK